MTIQVSTTQICSQYVQRMSKETVHIRDSACMRVIWLGVYVTQSQFIINMNVTYRIRRYASSYEVNSTVFWREHIALKTTEVRVFTLLISGVLERIQRIWNILFPSSVTKVEDTVLSLSPQPLQCDSFGAHKACIRRDIPWQLWWSGQRKKKCAVGPLRWVRQQVGCHWYKNVTDPDHRGWATKASHHPIFCTVPNVSHSE